MKCLYIIVDDPGGQPERCNEDAVMRITFLNDLCYCAKHAEVMKLGLWLQPGDYEYVTTDSGTGQ